MPFLAGALSDEDVVVRRACARRLGHLDALAAADALVGCLNDPDPLLPAIAARSLQQLTGQDLGTSPEAWRQWLATKEKRGTVEE